ncbi:MAG TPA: hypothetical protein VI299_16315 [Polyangiales bacterium]
MRRAGILAPVRMLVILALLSVACTPAQDPQAFLDYEASFLRPGVDLESEEREVRRVLGQRGLRVNARVEQHGYVALSAMSRDRRLTALRLITARGVVVAEDADSEDLFQPARIALLEHFGGTTGEFSLLAYAHVPLGQDVGCVTLQRVLPDGNAVAAIFDVSQLGARACVSNLAPGRGGRVRAKIAWPSLHAVTTPQIDAELAFDEPKGEAALPAIPIVRLAPGPWLDQETARYANMSLLRADFSRRHAVGVARAALAHLVGKDRSVQVDLYRQAVGTVPPGSFETQVASDTLRHIQSDWLDAPEPPPDATRPTPEVHPPAPIEPAEPLPEDSIVVEPPGEAR